jgi:hypothetical protein
MCDLVYVVDYVVCGAFLDCAQPKEQQKSTYLFPLLGLVQHIGVLLACGSMHWFAFPWLWIIAVVQSAMFVVWLTQAMLHWMAIWSEFIFIFIVGVFAGLIYVNTYHCILQDERLTEKEKELGTNFTGMTVTIAVLVASAFTYVSEQTFLKPFVPTE